jgi:hypothetical protein
MTVITFPTAFAGTTAASDARATSARAPRLRITARGRRVVATLVAIPLALIAVVIGVNATGAVATQAPVVNSFTYVSVEPGQSLWQVAEQLAPTADPREVVADIVSLNQLPSADVAAGQKLAIPADYAG